MKKKLFFLVCIFFVIGLTLLGKIYAAEVYVPSPNNVNPLKVPAVTSADSVLCDKLNLAKEESDFQCTFQGEEDDVNVPALVGKNYALEEITVRKGKIPSYAKVNYRGELIKLDALVSNRGAELTINGNKFYAPPHSVVKYEEGKGVSISIPDGGEVSSLPSLSVGATAMPIKFNGTHVKLPEGYILSSGQISYLNGAFSVEKGNKANINGFEIKPSNNNVELRFGKKSFFDFGKEEGNFVRFYDGKVRVGGEGFSIRFTPYTLSGFSSSGPATPSAGFITGSKRSYKLGDKPKDGTREFNDIKNIQTMLGITPTGVYDSVTYEKIKEWQSSIYQSSGSCVGYFSGKNCISDGIFGSKSAKVMQGGEVGENSASSLTIFPKGGSAEFFVDKTGLSSSFFGKIDFDVGDKYYSFDGISFNQKMVKSVFDSGLNIPSKLSFFDESGKEVGSMTATGKDSFFRKFSSQQLLKDYTKEGKINPYRAQCAATVCHLYNEQSKDASMKFNEKAGVFGAAWEMKKHMLAKNGRSIYSSEDFLSAEEKSKLDQLKQSVNEEYSSRMATIENLKNSDLPKYEIEKGKIITDLSDRIRKEEGDILNRRITNPVDLESGDIISFYYKDSDYLSEAMVNGLSNQKNTHVGAVTGFKETKIKLSDSSNSDSVNSQLMKSLNVKNKDSLYVNQYYAKLPGFDGYQKVTFVGGKFFDENVQQITAIDELLVKRPEVTHLIHYGKDKNPLHVEFLDQTVDRPDLSLYGVTRANEKVRNQIVVANTPSPTPKSSVVISQDTSSKNCNGEKCKGFESPIEKARYLGVSNAVIDNLQKVSIPKSVPSYQKNSFTSAILAVTSLEGGKSKVQVLSHLAERTFARVAGIDEGVSQGTFTQVKSGTLAQAATFLKRDISGIDLTTDEGSMKATSFIMEAIFKKYIPSNRKVLTDNDIKVIGAAWNSGLDSAYTRALANGEILPSVNPQEADSFKGRVGNVKGRIASYYWKGKGYDTSTYFNAYPDRYKDAFKSYCC
ncbi:hypothetical protein J4474_05095 [Candidatus Pacearchaeota archaeon]|nr:hypothetical protein [Candidatus Pacearchaeota archaeon]